MVESIESRMCEMFCEEIEEHVKGVGVGGRKGKETE